MAIPASLLAALSLDTHSTPVPPITPAFHLVLLVHPGAMGDLVQALPACGAVRAAFPDARLMLLTDAALADLARGTRLFDDVLGFDASVAYHGSGAARIRLIAELVAGVRRAGPDAVAVFKGAPVYAALAVMSGARRRVGLARGIGAALLTDAIPIDPHRHHEDRFMDVAVALGADPAQSVAAAWPTRDHPDLIAVRARAWPVIGIGPGGARNAKADAPTKRWRADRFAALARELATAHPDAAFILLGARADRAELDTVAVALRGRDVLDLGGATDVAAARTAIATCDVYIGNDSGLMHIAATTGTPSVIAFGPTDPRVIAPRARSVYPVWDPVPDAPCYDDVAGVQRTCATPCCIDRVCVGAMRAAVDSALARARRTHRDA